MSVTPPLAELTALVIDGASGPGRIVSSRLSAAGASVAIVTVSDGGSAAYLSKELTGLGLTALPYQVDLADRASLEQLLADVTQDLGRLHLLVNLLPDAAVAVAGGAGSAQLRTALLDVLATACRGGRLIQLASTTPPAPGAAAQVRVDTVEVSHPLPHGWADPAVPASVHHATANAVLLLLGIPVDADGAAEAEAGPQCQGGGWC